MKELPLSKFTCLMASLLVAGTLSSTAMAHNWKLGIAMQHNPGGGVRIVNVFPGSPAEDARLQPGMILLSVNGVPMNSPMAVRNFILNDNSDHLNLEININGWLYLYQAEIVTISAVVVEGHSGVAALAKQTLRITNIKRIGPAR
ncbi:MAG: PDZ domain-containing protein [Gemmataceae bacterium]